MIGATADILVFEEIGRVFQFVALDFVVNYPRWSPEVLRLEALSPGPVRPGFQARQVRVDQGRRSESKFKISAFEPGQRITLVGVSDPFRCTYELQEITPAQSTKLTFTFELLEILAIMRPFEGLVRVAIRDGADRTVQNIKRLVESKQP